jgi:hypothetical protein
MLNKFYDNLSERKRPFFALVNIRRKNMLKSAIFEQSHSILRNQKEENNFLLTFERDVLCAGVERDGH